MNFLFAWRYFKSKKSTNAINIIAWVSILAIAVVTASIIIVLSVFNGFEDLVKSLYTDFYADIKISSKLNKTIQISDEQLNKIANLNGIQAVSKVIEEKTVLTNDDYQTIAVIKGVDKNYLKVSSLKKYIKRGSYDLGNAENPNIVLGAGLENAIGTDVERAISPIVLYVPNKKRNTSVTSLESFNSSTIVPNAAFLIQQEFDSKYAFTNIEFMRYMLDIDEKTCTQLEVKINKNAVAIDIKNRLLKLIGNDYKVETRYEQNESLFKIMQIEKWFIYGLLSFIMLIAAFNIVGALTMLVLEKNKDIQILRAMGATTKLIQKIFLTNGILLAFIGGIIGIAIALIICLIQIKFHVIPLQGGTFIVDYYPVKMLPIDFLLTLLTIGSISFIASYFPSKKAAKTNLMLKS